MSVIQPVAPDAVRWIVRTLEEGGYETWGVGGAIRDAVLGRRSGDWDLATRARPSQVRRLFKRTVPIGVEHGTIGVLARDGTLFEVTTFRKDVDTDGRHAVVEFADTIGEDLSRRDFTINAIAWHPLREELFDPFDGAGDLERHVLRTVGAARDRFHEDYLRILRAIRFAGRFELDMEEDTWSALGALVDRLPALSAERIRDELLKVLGADPRPGRALSMYRTSGALHVLFPEVEALAETSAGVGSWSHTLGVIDRLPAGRPHLRLAALLRPLQADAVAAVLMRLRLSNANVDDVARLAGLEPLPAPDAAEEDVRRWLSRHGVTSLHAAARMDLAAARHEDGGAPSRCASVVAGWRRAKAVCRARPPLRVAELAIDGRDLIRLGLRPGPRFGDVLEGLLDWVLEDPARNAPDVLAPRALELHESLSPSGGGPIE